MEKITCLLFRGSDWLDKIIRWEARGEYTHVAFIVDGVLFESRPGHGVRALEKQSDIDTYLSSRTVDYFDVEVTTDQKDKIKEFARKQVGKGYDYVMVLSFLSKATNQSRKSSGKWFCSEYLFESLAQGDVRLLARIESWKVNPTMVSFSTLLKEH